MSEMLFEDQIKGLKKENSRLKNLLKQHGIAFTVEENLSLQSNHREHKALSVDEKIAIFKELFVGRTDVYAKQWSNKHTKKKGYSTLSLNEWVPKVCMKQKIKCSVG